MSLTNQIFSAGIVGCGGAGFPTHVKYNAKPEHLIINAAECEPLLRTDRYVMCNYAPEIIAGCEAAMQHLGAKDCTIALKEPYVEEIAALQNAIDQKNSKVTLHTFPSFYPAGDEQVMVYEVTGKVVPPAAIPLEVGCVVSNVATILAIHDAAADKPFTHKFLTMTGEVANPTVLHVPIGTSFADCLAQAGGANIEDYFVINGGPMMGKPLTKEQALATTVTKTTSGYILLPKDSRLPSLHQTPVEHTINRAKAACIQCTYCSELCPRHMLGHPIQPHKMMRKIACGSAAQVAEDPEAINALLCCECGVCELFACPMGLQPRKVNALIKQELGKKGIRYPKQAQTYEADANREYRKIPTKRAANRAGVGKYYDYQIKTCKEFEPQSVTISLKQHIGAPSEAVVAVGDTVDCGQLIAACPDGSLGANIHASISGTVSAVENMSITIQKK